MAVKKKIEYTPIDGERLREALKAYKKRSGKSATWLSYKVAESGSMLSNAMLRDKIPTEYVATLELAGIHPEEYVVQPEKTAPEAPEKPQEEQKEKSRPDDHDLRKELQRLRDDVADLGIMINALRQDRERDTGSSCRVSPASRTDSSPRKHSERRSSPESSWHLDRQTSTSRCAPHTTQSETIYR